MIFLLTSVAFGKLLNICNPSLKNGGTYSCKTLLGEAVFRVKNCWTNPYLFILYLSVLLFFFFLLFIHV